MEHTCSLHRETVQKIADLARQAENMQDTIVECTNDIKESAVLLSNVTQSLERFSASIDRFAERLQNLEIARAKHEAYLDTAKEIENKFNQRLIVFGTLLAGVGAFLGYYLR